MNKTLREKQETRVHDVKHSKGELRLETGGARVCFSVAVMSHIASRNVVCTMEYTIPQKIQKLILRSIKKTNLPDIARKGVPHRNIFCYIAGHVPSF